MNEETKNAQNQEEISVGDQIGAIWKLVSGLIMIGLAIWLLSSCQTGNAQQANSQLTMKITTFVGDVKTSVLSIENLGEYYEVTLSAFPDEENGGSRYGVRIDIEEGKFVNDVFHWKISELVDETTKEELWFKEPTDFLNYLSTKGYEMVEQKKGKYNIDYTFKKKS